eukprot:gene10880-10962_t
MRLNNDNDLIDLPVMTSTDRLRPKDRHLIKRYAAQRFYDMKTMSYVTLSDIRDLRQSEHDIEIEIIDATSGVDITKWVLPPQLH